MLRTGTIIRAAPKPVNPRRNPPAKTTPTTITNSSGGGKYKIKLVTLNRMLPKQSQTNVL
jgi:hypothetical protein